MRVADHATDEQIEALAAYYAGRCARCGVRGCQRHKKATPIAAGERTRAQVLERLEDLTARDLELREVAKHMRQFDRAGGWTIALVRETLNDEIFAGLCPSGGAHDR